MVPFLARIRIWIQGFWKDPDLVGLVGSGSEDLDPEKSTGSATLMTCVDGSMTCVDWSMTCVDGSMTCVDGSMTCVDWTMTCVYRSMTCVYRSMTCFDGSMTCVAGSMTLLGGKFLQKGLLFTLVAQRSVFQFL